MSRCGWLTVGCLSRGHRSISLLLSPQGALSHYLCRHFPSAGWPASLSVPCLETLGFAPCLETFQLGASGFLLCYTCDLKWYLSLILPGLVGPVVPLVVPA